MCGIAGVILKNTDYTLDIDACLSNMAQSMYHRGPDDIGIFISPDGRVGFTNRRLAIRDISPAGHMPMTNIGASICITYNGEIYNAGVLRAELESTGVVFTSTSDTEVILCGYEVWGMAIIPRLEGMFAFAIYDCRSLPRVILARDHMGIKPLYYAVTSNAVLFASELKTLLASTLISNEISSSGLVGYLLFGSVPNPLSIYHGIVALEPASFIELSLNEFNLSNPITYWKLPHSTLEAIDFEEGSNLIEELLIQAVRSQLVSDVPLGAFLSGGLDSSLIVALMRLSTTGPIYTCSISFDEQTHSESVFSKAMAQSIGAEHFERVVTAQDLMNEFDHILSALDQPSIDGVNTYFVSQTARQTGLTVALSGLGGDELFGGYPNTFNTIPQIYAAMKLAHAVPAGLRIGKYVLKLLKNKPGWDRLSDALDSPPSLSSAYLTRRGLFSRNEVKRLVDPQIWYEAEKHFSLLEHIDAHADTVSQDVNDSFAWISRAELRTYTHHQLLRDTDVMSMAHSLEVRVPFFDTRLVAASLKLPTKIKMGKRDVPKPLLANIAKAYLPDLITKRKDKMGFTFPFDIWLRNGLKGKVRDVFSQVKRSKMMKGEEVENIFNGYVAGQFHWSRLWALVTLGILTD